MTSNITTTKSLTDETHPWELRINGKIEGRFRTKNKLYQVRRKIAKTGRLPNAL